MNTRSYTSSARSVALILPMVTGTALAQTTITGTAGGGDSWNDPINWTAGVPTGAIDAIVSAGLLAQVSSGATPSYSGSLTLNANSTLRMACSMTGPTCGQGSENAVEGVSVIIMHAGSEIQVNINEDVDFPAFMLLGDAKLSSLFGASDHETDNYGPITGAHTLTLEHFNNHTINLNAANGFSELIADTVDRWNLRARAAGSLGTGNVTINPRMDGRSASLFIDTDDAMADTATLTLNGTPGQGGFSGNGSDYVVLNANDTIAALYVYGVQQPLGTYTNTQAWISGSGTFTVADPAIGMSYCGPAVASSTGQSGILTVTGSALVANNASTLNATGLPSNQFGYFLNSLTPGFVPQPGSSQGNLCLAGAIGRYNPAAGYPVQNSSTTGSISLTLDLTSTPTPAGFTSITAGQTWNFQAWYRDLNPGPTSNFTDAVSVTFL